MKPRTIQKIGSIPMPTKGLMTITSPTDIPPEYAWVFNNIFPSDNGFTCREGVITHKEISGLVSAGTLFITVEDFYNLSNTLIPLCITPNTIYNISGSPVAVGTSASAATIAPFVFRGLIHFPAWNGGLYTYDGTTYGATGLTGPTLASCPLGCGYRDRIYLIEQTSTTKNLWYGGVNAIAGAMSSYDITSFFLKGGSIRHIFSISGSYGTRSDDFLVVISAEGEVVVFSGDYPGSALVTWQIVGRFLIPKPIGYGFYGLQQIDNKWLIITMSGVLDIGKMVNAMSGSLNIIDDFSFPVRNLFNYFGSQGTTLWNMSYSSRFNALFISNQRHWGYSQEYPYEGIILVYSFATQTWSTITADLTTGNTAYGKCHIKCCGALNNEPYFTLPNADQTKAVILKFNNDIGISINKDYDHWAGSYKSIPITFASRFMGIGTSSGMSKISFIKPYFYFYKNDRRDSWPSPSAQVVVSDRLLVNQNYKDISYKNIYIPSTEFSNSRNVTATNNIIPNNAIDVNQEAFNCSYIFRLEMPTNLNMGFNFLGCDVFGQFGGLV